MRRRNPFQDYLNAIKKAWIAFIEKYPYEWFMTQTDVDMVRRIWIIEAPQFSIHALWAAHRLFDPDQLPLASEVYQRTINEPTNKALIDYFTRFNEIPLEIEKQVWRNNNRSSVQ